MVETWILYGLSGLILFFGGLVGGFLAQLVASRLDKGELAAVRAQVMRLSNTIYSADGVKAREAKSERQQEAMLALATAVKGGKEPAEAVKEVAMQYPDVAMGLLQKALKSGQLGSLMGAGE